MEKNPEMDILQLPHLKLYPIHTLQFLAVCVVFDWATFCMLMCFIFTYIYVYEIK